MDQNDDREERKAELAEALADMVKNYERAQRDSNSRLRD